MSDYVFASELCKLYVENYDNLNADIKNELYKQIIYDIYGDDLYKNSQIKIILGYKILNEINSIEILYYNPYHDIIKELFNKSVFSDRNFSLSDDKLYYYMSFTVIPAHLFNQIKIEITITK
jgi:hypothetical protein